MLSLPPDDRDRGATGSGFSAGTAPDGVSLGTPVRSVIVGPEAGLGVLGWAAAPDGVAGCGSGVTTGDAAGASAVREKGDLAAAASRLRAAAPLARCPACVLRMARSARALRREETLVPSWIGSLRHACQLCKCWEHHVCVRMQEVQMMCRASKPLQVLCVHPPGGVAVITQG